MKKFMLLLVGLAIASAIAKMISGSREGEGAEATRMRDRARAAAAHRDPRSAVTASVDGAIGSAAVDVGGPHPASDVEPTDTTQAP